MIARATLAEIDVVRMPMDDAVHLFEESILPALHEREGFEGVYVLATPEGKALVLTFWETQEAADSELASGFYAAQVEKFVTVFRSPPGRETYEVALAQTPVHAPT
jgi:heme-degrading monooxygenase HmoA